MSGEFVDISAHNPPATQINWQAYKAWSQAGDGVSRISLKASEGAGIVDPNYHGYVQAARSAGIASIWHYHYARPDLGNSPQQEANYFIGTVGNIGGADLLMLDWEGDINNQPTGFTSEWAFEWLSAVSSHYGGKATVYSFGSFIRSYMQDSRLVQFPLIFADPTNNPDYRPPCPPPWSTYLAVQYSWTKSDVPGIPGGVDTNVYLGGPLMSTLPSGWHDDGKTLTGPNGVPIVLGFRLFVLPLLQSGHWAPDNVALAPQFYTAHLEASNPALGDGDQIIFRDGDMLGYPHNPQGQYAGLKNKVIREWTGVELVKTRQQVAKYYAQTQTDATQIAQLKDELAKATASVVQGLDPVKVADRLSAIGLAAANSNTAIQQLVNQPL